jgi:hypothetical protein
MNSILTVAAATGNSQASTAAMYTYVSALLSGSADPFWPHVVLISGSVLAGIAVGAGIIMESERWSLAILLVVVGVGVESICTIGLFGFDERISKAQQSVIEAQRSEIISLEKRLAFRSLTDEQFSDLVDQVKGTGAQTFQVITYWRDEEALAIANRVADALIKAGWTIDQPKAFTALVGVEAGIWVSYDGRADKKVGAAANALVYALLQHEIYAELDAQAVATPPANQPISDKINIEVGIKP